MTAAPSASRVITLTSRPSISSCVSRFHSSGCQRLTFQHRRAPRVAAALRMPVRALSQDELKKQAAWKAVEYVQSGMRLGLGTGSTAAFAVERIGELLKDGTLKDIVAVPTSIRTYEQAKSALKNLQPKFLIAKSRSLDLIARTLPLDCAGLGIPLATLAEQPELDLAIDGADEVDPLLNVVKGRGGALLREKMVELASDKFVCIVDDTKLVEGIGGSKDAMPIEVTQFGWDYNLTRLQNLPELEGSTAKLRRTKDGEPYVTDNSNYIIDCYFENGFIRDAQKAADVLSQMVGVVEHGLFLNMVNVVIIAGANGVEVKEKADLLHEAGMGQA